MDGGSGIAFSCLVYVAGPILIVALLLAGVRSWQRWSAGDRE